MNRIFNFQRETENFSRFPSKEKVLNATDAAGWRSQHQHIWLTNVPRLSIVAGTKSGLLHERCSVVVVEVAENSSKSLVEFASTRLANLS
jgi:hypothetical protein